MIYRVNDEDLPEACYLSEKRLNDLYRDATWQEALDDQDANDVMLQQESERQIQDTVDYHSKVKKILENARDPEQDKRRKQMSNRQRTANVRQNRADELALEKQLDSGEIDDVPESTTAELPQSEPETTKSAIYVPKRKYTNLLQQQRDELNTNEDKQTDD